MGRAVEALSTSLCGQHRGLYRKALPKRPGGGGGATYIKIQFSQETNPCALEMRAHMDRHERLDFVEIDLSDVTTMITTTPAQRAVCEKIGLEKHRPLGRFDTILYIVLSVYDHTIQQQLADSRQVGPSERGTEGRKAYSLLLQKVQHNTTHYIYPPINNVPKTRLLALYNNPSDHQKVNGEWQ